MTNIEVLENKISQVKKYLHILEGYKKYKQMAIEDDLNLKGALERYLYLVIQSTIDLAEGLVSFRKLRKPTTLADSFIILSEAGILSESLTDRMIKMTGFRNIITHDYADIDFDIVYGVLMEGVKDISLFLGEAESISGTS